MDGYTELANAIVERAVIDYHDAVEYHDLSTADSLEKFFFSEWFHLLSDLDGKTIINHVLSMEVSV